MPTYETSTTIPAAPDAVWSVLADVVNWPHWTPTVTKVEALDSPRIGMGARFEVHQPELRPAVWAVTRIEDPTRFLWESRMPGFVMVADHVLEPLPGGASRLTLSFAFQGLLGAIVGPLFRKRVESYIAKEAASLRGLFEGGGTR
jgi:uncharacterized membrane protein